MKFKIKKSNNPLKGELCLIDDKPHIYTGEEWRGIHPGCPLTPFRTEDRLPKPSEVDVEGRCWCASERPYPDDPIKKWELRRVRHGDNYFPQDEFWLPYYSLPSNA